MDTAIQNYARTLALRSPDHYRVGPFTVRHNPGWELKFANYAIPDQGAVCWSAYSPATGSYYVSDRESYSFSFSKCHSC